MKRLLTARDLGVRLGERVVLRGVDLSLDAREVVTIVGPNGAGKSTLLKLLLGLIRPTWGEVQRAPGLEIGYLPQKILVDPSLPINVQRLLGLHRGADRGQIAAALAETGVSDREKSLIQTLSGGELQRVLIARAILGNPDLLVLDEPVQGVDVQGEAALYRLIRSIRDRHGCGILMVSHDLHRVMSATDRVICLNGHVCCTGEPSRVRLHPEYLRLFGEPVASAIDIYHHHHDHTHHPEDGSVLCPDREGRTDSVPGRSEEVDLGKGGGVVALGKGG
ncbi:MAG: metal ABC transporter ATP-binding protein, partial [Magnetococcales bacterium]|nr:metal ABC transporter ATP-binding protein [Magnetococcales bacterium]